MGDGGGDFEEVTGHDVGMAHVMSGVNSSIRANGFGTIPVGRFFSCCRREAHPNSDLANVMSTLGLALLMIGLRADLVFSPGPEGTKLQKHGGRHFGLVAF